MNATYSQLKDRLGGVTGIDIDELIERVRLLSVAYGKQKSKVEYMVEFRKAKLYSVIEDRRGEFEEAGEKVTETRLEAIARASKDYKDYLKRMYNEKVALVQAEADYYAARNQFDALIEMIRYARSERYQIENN